MWQPYLKVIARKASGAIQVLDRFHIIAHLSKAIDEVRAKEAESLKATGYEPVLKGMRFCLLKRPENLTDSQQIKLAELVRYNLRTVRAYLLKEDFQFFWQYVSPDRHRNGTARGERERPPTLRTQLSADGAVVAAHGCIRRRP